MPKPAEGRARRGEFLPDRVGILLGMERAVLAHGRLQHQGEHRRGVMAQGAVAVHERGCDLLLVGPDC